MLRNFFVFVLFHWSVAVQQSSFLGMQRKIQKSQRRIVEERQRHAEESSPPPLCFSDTGELGECGEDYPRCQVSDWNVGPRYHLQDATCGINDPAGPFYDAVHGMYHLFYQAHVYNSDYINAPRVQGHMASRDLAHWTHLPVAIWNDMEYDGSSVWTGSTTVVDNTPYQFYTANAPGRHGIAVAIPQNPADPFYKNWTKPSFNPILDGTERDPSTAWQTPDKEYRFVTYRGEVYGSKDFKRWHRIGTSNFGGGECPSFFPIPKTSPGTNWSAYPNDIPKPTHVSKWSAHGHDIMQVGVYDSAKWTPYDMKERYFDKEGAAAIDAGMTYAGKDMYDPVKDRRIMWSWGRGYPREITKDTPSDGHFSFLTLAREITWNPELQLLQFSPLEEQKLLRGEQICSLSNTPISADQYHTLGKGRQVEIKVVFDLPTEDSTFGIVVMGGADFSKQGSFIAVHYRALANNTEPFAVDISVSVYGSVIKDFPVVSGNKLWLLPSDQTLSLQIFVDETFSEIYWQGGRQVMSAVTPPSEEGFMAVTSTTPVTLRRARAWAVDSPFVSEEEQLKIPRLDRRVPNI